MTRELVAAVAEHVVGVAAGGDDRLRDVGQEPVAGLVAEGVVDGLEVVEVEHDQAERLAAVDALRQPALEGPVIEQPGHLVRLGPDLDGPVDLGVLERDRDLRREELDELELVLRVERHPGPAARASGRRWPRRDRAAGRRSGCRPSVTSRKWLIRSSVRSSSTRAGSLWATTQVARPSSPGSHGSMYWAAWMPRAVSGRRRPLRRIDGLDRDVVVADELRKAIRDLVEDRVGIEGGQDRFRDLEEAALVDELTLERLGLGAEACRRVGGGEGLCGEARIDDEEPQVVVAELVEPELREHEHAEDLVLERHRSEEHRLVEVFLGARRSCSPADRLPRSGGSGRRDARRPSR